MMLIVLRSHRAPRRAGRCAASPPQARAGNKDAQDAACRRKRRSSRASLTAQPAKSGLQPR
eukprot:8668564-Lingulodinium_polyedra.AAC.1